MGEAAHDQHKIIVMAESENRHCSTRMVCDGDGTSCIEILGCTYQEATNYNPDAITDDGSCEFMLGDFNQDGTLNVLDIVAIVQAILGGW